MPPANDHWVAGQATAPDDFTLVGGSGGKGQRFGLPQVWAAKVCPCTIHAHQPEQCAVYGNFQTKAERRWLIALTLLVYVYLSDCSHRLRTAYNMHDSCKQFLSYTRYVEKEVKKICALTS